MDTLRISLFGGVQIQQGVSALPLKVTRIMQGLLAYLLLHPTRGQPREVLAELFWGEQPPERAHNCLNTALWRLRQVLEPEGVARGTYLVTTSSGEVAFNWESDHWLDVGIFEQKARKLLAKPLQLLETADVQGITQTLELCRGELLEGFYDDWVLREREYLRQLQLSTLARVLNFHTLRQEYEAGIACGQHILAIEPLSEEFHRQLMRLYAENGQRALALRQYELCRALLAKELEIAPMTETQTLYAQIKMAHTGSIMAPPAVEGTGVSSGDTGKSEPVKNEAVNGQQVLHQLHEAISVFEEARRLLQRAIQAMEHLV